MLTKRDFAALRATSDARPNAPIRHDLARCARCGTPHRLLFARLLRPIQTCSTTVFTHWAICPVTHEPVLMTYLLGSVRDEDAEPTR